jgi:hypothetical protein
MGRPISYQAKAHPSRRPSTTLHGFCSATSHILRTKHAHLTCGCGSPDCLLRPRENHKRWLAASEPPYTHVPGSWPAHRRPGRIYCLALPCLLTGWYDGRDNQGSVLLPRSRDRRTLAKRCGTGMRAGRGSGWRAGCRSHRGRRVNSGTYFRADCGHYYVEGTALRSRVAARRHLPSAPEQRRGTRKMNPFARSMSMTVATCRHQARRCLTFNGTSFLLPFPAPFLCRGSFSSPT